jgi:hypothetical protein
MTVETSTMTEVATALPRPARQRARRGPDRLTVALLTLTAFLLVLAVLAGRLRAAPAAAPTRHVVVLRRIYRTTIIDDSRSAGAGESSSSVSVSTSGGGGGATPAAPATRTSGA